jgi:hypothetical protein
VHLWVVPAHVQGLWCGTGPLNEFSLKLTQRYQLVQGTLTRKQRAREISGKLHGAILRTEPTRHGSLEMELAGDLLRLVGGQGPIALARGTSFHRATGERCG